MNRISAWSRRCWWTSCARPKSATRSTGSKTPSARQCMPTHARGAISARYLKGGPPMDDKMRRIAPSDLSMLRNTSTERTVTYSAAAAISPSSTAACPHCDGAGYYKEEVPYGHPNFGKLMPCVCKHQELSQRAAEKLYEISNLGPFSEKTFKNFDSTVFGVQSAYMRAHQ